MTWRFPVHLDALREEIATIARETHTRGWVANHDGNLSVRLPDDTLLATPTAVSKRKISASDLLILAKDGTLLSGAGRPFSELSLHLAVLEARPDQSVVLHAHPPHATAFAICNRDLPVAIAEGVVSLGATIPVAPYAPPGSPESNRAAARASRISNGFLLASHGVMTTGTSPEQAFLRMELIEHLAHIHIAAQALGSPQALPDADLALLLAKREKAGLSPPGAGDLDADNQWVHGEIQRLLGS
jgi:L-fuculose-phosphate aldolase